MYFSYTRTLLPCMIIALCFSFIPLYSHASYTAKYFLNCMVNKPSVCVYCSGSRAQLRTMLSCSSHPLTLLCLVTKQADGMALVRVKHRRPSLNIKFHVDCREEWFSAHCGLMQVDNIQYVQHKALAFSCFFLAPSTRKMDEKFHR